MSDRLVGMRLEYVLYLVEAAIYMDELFPHFCVILTKRVLLEWVGKFTKLCKFLS